MKNFNTQWQEPYKYQNTIYENRGKRHYNKGQG